MLTRMGELRSAITAAPARDIADVAVKLRRLVASLSLGGLRVKTFKPGPYERRLLTFALAAVEAAVVRGA